MTTPKNQESLQEQLQGEKTVIVQFGSETCNPCKAIQSKIMDWIKNYPQIEYIYIPVEDAAEMCAQMGVFTVPTIFVYVEGKLTLRESGYFGLTELFNKIEQYDCLLHE